MSSRLKPAVKVSKHMFVGGRFALGAGRRASIALIIISQIAAMTLWFSATAAASVMVAADTLAGQQAGLLTGAVQIGFVFGTLASAALGLADRFDPRRLFASCALIGAGVNALLLVTSFDSLLTVFLRFTTGAILAGVYPVGMKMAAAWTEKAVGLMIGTLVGALTLGSSLPYFFNAIAGLEWRVTVAMSSGCAIISAVGISLSSLGPGYHRALHFRFGEALRSLSRRSMLFANFGYLGHMWELYAMWAWIGVFLRWALEETSSPLSQQVDIITFAVIASGALGSIGAGILADRFGRTTITICAMLVSGTCAAVIGFLPPLGSAVVIVVAVVWGLAVVADSAQFSASVAELAEQHLVGTMLTLQTCMGFLLTFLIIQVMPLVVSVTGWTYGFMILSIGPAFGVFAMWRLRKHPDAMRLAHGRS